VRRDIVVNTHLIGVGIPIKNVLDIVRRPLLLPGTEQGPVGGVRQWRRIIDLLPLVGPRKLREELGHPLEQNPTNLLFYKMIGLEIRNHDVNTGL